jgi:ketosteroid isomerase-like protein
MAEGDFDGLLSVYDPEVVFLNQAGELIKGKQELKQELYRFAAARARFDFDIAQVIQSDDIALMHHPVEYLRTSADIRVRNRGRTSPARRHVALAHWRSVYGRQTRTSRDCRYWKLNGMSRAKLTFCSFVLSASPAIFEKLLRTCAHNYSNSHVPPHTQSQACHDGWVQMLRNLHRVGLTPRNWAPRL